MTSRGLLVGIRRTGWQSYKPRLRVVTVGGGSTQPAENTDANDGGQHQGRFQLLAGGICIVQTQMVFPFGLSVGTGDAYVVSLPHPIDRQGYPFVEGTAMGYQSFQDPQLVLPLVPQTVDRAQFVELGPGGEDRHIGFRYPYYFEQGTGTFTSAATSMTVNHSCPWTPLASEVNFVASTVPSNTQSFPWSVATTSSNFTITARNGTGTPGVDFGWKIVAFPAGGVDSLVGPKKPWAWTNLENLFCQFYYAAQT